MKKICATCSQEKDEGEFNWRYKALGIRHPTCRECQKSFRANWYRKNKDRHLQNVKTRKYRVRDEARQFVLDYLSTHPCSECGESDPVVLEFHHIEGKDKDISHMVVDGRSLAAIQVEIERCRVVCANCHRRITARERGWFRSRNT